MAKQKFRPTRLGGFSGEKAYIRYAEVLKKRRNAAGRTFCDAINSYSTLLGGIRINKELSSIEEGTAGAHQYECPNLIRSNVFYNYLLPLLRKKF
jgi:hypothetical protein